MSEKTRLEKEVSNMQRTYKYRTLPIRSVIVILGDLGMPLGRGTRTLQLPTTRHWSSGHLPHGGPSACSAMPWDSSICADPTLVDVTTGGYSTYM